MNRNQWFVLGIFFILMNTVFIQLDTSALPCLNVAGETTATESDIVSSIYCIVNAEILEPFIWLFFPLGLICFVLGWLEPKKK